MNNKLITVMVTVILGVILTCTVLIPVTSLGSEAHKTVENVGMPFTEAGGDHVIVVDSTGITYDGDAVDMSLFPGNFQTYTLVYGEESFVRWGVTNVLTVSDSDGLKTFNVSVGNTVTITLTGTSVTVTTTASTQTFTANDVLYHISPSGGDYVLALNPYLTEGDTVYAAGDTFFSSGGRPGPIRLWIVWTGDNEDVTVVASGYSGTSYDSCSVTNTTVNISNPTSNLYKYDSVVFDWTATATVDEESTDYPLTSTYTYFLAPAEVTYDNPTYVSSIAGLIAAIPILAIIGIVLAVVGVAIVGRNDY